MLRGVATSGTAARVHRELKRNDIGGKTGTTNESHDAWFAGFTPRLVGIAWMGYDQPRSLGSTETGGGASLPIWLDYMRPALKGQPEAPPPAMPDGLAKVDGDFYFSEFPPGQAVARVGLPTHHDVPVDGGGADGISDLLNQLTGSRASTRRIEPPNVPF
jgi:penicillin-binding protein 1A